MNLKTKKKLLEMEIEVYKLHLQRQKDSIDKEADLYRREKRFEIDKELSLKNIEKLKNHLPESVNEQIVVITKQLDSVTNELRENKILLKFKDEQIASLKIENHKAELLIEKLIIKNK